jgi:4-diphosphocytidyl-2-C-methyl-D-erythritol kinase
VKRIKIKAFAKINLGLRVLDKREDGYHNIETVLQTISLFDQLDISIGNGSIVVTSDNPELPQDENNLCYKASKIFQEKSGHKKGVHINLQKNIPIGAGLGGGSSDAASVLTGLNILFSFPFEKNEIRRMAISIGSDIPFFIDGGTAFVTGRGEIIKPIKPGPFLNYLVVFPGFGIDTKWAYEKINFLTKRENYIKILNCNFDVEDIKNNKMLLKNDFEEVMLREYAKLREVRRFLIQNGAASVSLSGSGSSIYGIFDDLKKMDRAYTNLAEEGYWVKKVFSIRSSEIPQFSLKHKEDKNGNNGSQDHTER